MNHLNDVSHTLLCMDTGVKVHELEHKLSNLVGDRDRHDRESEEEKERYKRELTQLMKTAEVLGKQVGCVSSSPCI